MGAGFEQLLGPSRRYTPPTAALGVEHTTPTFADSLGAALNVTKQTGFGHAGIRKIMTDTSQYWSKNTMPKKQANETYNLGLNDDGGVIDRDLAASLYLERKQADMDRQYLQTHNTGVATVLAGGFIASLMDPAEFALNVATGAGIGLIGKGLSGTKAVVGAAKAGQLSISAKRLMPLGQQVLYRGEEVGNIFKAAAQRATNPLDKMHWLGATATEAAVGTAATTLGTAAIAGDIGLDYDYNDAVVDIVTSTLAAGALSVSARGVGRIGKSIHNKAVDRIIDPEHLVVARELAALNGQPVHVSKIADIEGATKRLDEAYSDIAKDIVLEKRAERPAVTELEPLDTEVPATRPKSTAAEAPKTEYVDVDTYKTSTKYHTDGHMDARKVAADVVSKVDTAIASGRKVILVTDDGGKRVNIVGTDSMGGLIDDSGQSWGTVSFLFTKRKNGKALDRLEFSDPPIVKTEAYEPKVLESEEAAAHATPIEKEILEEATTPKRAVEVLDTNTKDLVDSLMDYVQVLSRYPDNHRTRRDPSRNPAYLAELQESLRVAMDKMEALGVAFSFKSSKAGLPKQKSVEAAILHFQQTAVKANEDVVAKVLAGRGDTTTLRDDFNRLNKAVADQRSVINRQSTKAETKLAAEAKIQQLVPELVATQKALQELEPGKNWATQLTLQDNLAVLKDMLPEGFLDMVNALSGENVDIELPLYKLREQVSRNIKNRIDDTRAFVDELVSSPTPDRLPPADRQLLNDVEVFLKENSADSLDPAELQKALITGVESEIKAMSNTGLFTESQVESVNRRLEEITTQFDEELVYIQALKKAAPIADACSRLIIEAE